MFGIWVEDSHWIFHMLLAKQLKLTFSRSRANLAVINIIRSFAKLLCFRSKTLFNWKLSVTFELEICCNKTKSSNEVRVCEGEKRIFEFIAPSIQYFIVSKADISTFHLTPTNWVCANDRLCLEKKGQTSIDEPLNFTIVAFYSNKLPLFIKKSSSRRTQEATSLCSWAFEKNWQMNTFNEDESPRHDDNFRQGNLWESYGARNSTAALWL